VIKGRQLRHAAALALFGWYLITPPWTYRSEDRSKPVAQRRYTANPDAPYSQWSIEQSFDSADKCEEGRKEGQTWANNQLSNWLYAICIASDDPRLKEK